MLIIVVIIIIIVVVVIIVIIRYNIMQRGYRISVFSSVLSDTTVYILYCIVYQW